VSLGVRFGAGWLTFVLSAHICCEASAQPSQAGGEGLFDVRTAAVPVSRSFSAALTGTRYVINPDQYPERFHITQDLSVLAGGISLSGGIADRVEAFARFDAVRTKRGDLLSFAPSDGLLGVKVALPWGGRWMQTGLLASGKLSWGNRRRGFSTGSLDPELTALVTVPLPESNTLTSARLHFNIGYHWHGDSRPRGFDGVPPYYLEPVYPAGSKDRLDLRGALELRAERLTLFAEILLDQILAREVRFRESAMFLTPGLRYSLSESVAILLGSKIALATDDETTRKYRPPEDLYPEWQLVFGLSWSRMGPGADRDGDGVPDFRDRCPRAAEDLDGFEDDDGCPDPDNDNDGVIDAFDGSPNEREDFDGYQDSDGVPDLDNDGDGLPDTADDCPDSAEDADGILDEDGCPEEDADGDGILDVEDDCPLEAEVPNGIEDEDGCPESVGLAEPFRLQGVIWAGAEVAPSPLSYVALNQLVGEMKANPELMIELRVHPDRTSSLQDRLQLADRRAEYLRGYLVASGIDPTRVSAVGGGEPRIKAPPDSPGSIEGGATPHAWVEIIPNP
jgi:hypothetical protein